VCDSPLGGMRRTTSENMNVSLSAVYAKPGIELEVRRARYSRQPMAEIADPVGWTRVPGWRGIESRY